MFDANGVETLQESFNHLAPGGRLVVYGVCFTFCIFFSSCFSWSRD